MNSALCHIGVRQTRAPGNAVAGVDCGSTGHLPKGAFPSFLDGTRRCALGASGALWSAQAGEPPDTKRGKAWSEPARNETTSTKQ